MSLDLNSFLAGVKQAAVEAVDAGKPFALVFGVVTGVSPLSVMVDQKLPLTSAQLILTSAVRDFTVNMTVNHMTEMEGVPPHTHAYAGTKAFRVHRGLSVGEQVLLLRADGGQKFIVLDRVVTAG